MYLKWFEAFKVIRGKISTFISNCQLVKKYKKKL